MDIQKININKLNPAKYNPRKQLKAGDSEYEKLKKSIETFGYVEPVVWNKQTGNVVGGHQRITVLKDLGIKEIDCVIVDLHVNDEKALNVALNKVSGIWDDALLKDLLQELDNGMYDLELTGFDTKEIEDLMTQFHIDTPEVIDNADVEASGTSLKSSKNYIPIQIGNYIFTVDDEVNKQFLEEIFEEVRSLNDENKLKINKIIINALVKASGDIRDEIQS
jgi:ParB-like chromosome segregation protein Spo0J